MKNSKVGKVKTDRSADTEHRIEPQSLKLVGNNEKGARDHFRGLGSTQKLSFKEPRFGLVRPSSALALKCEENEN